MPRDMPRRSSDENLDRAVGCFIFVCGVLGLLFALAILGAIVTALYLAIENWG